MTSSRGLQPCVDITNVSLILTFGCSLAKNAGLGVPIFLHTMFHWSMSVHSQGAFMYYIHWHGFHINTQHPMVSYNTLYIVNHSGNTPQQDSIHNTSGAALYNSQMWQISTYVTYKCAIYEGKSIVSRYYNRINQSADCRTFRLHRPHQLHTQTVPFNVC